MTMAVVGNKACTPEQLQDGHVTIGQDFIDYMGLYTHSNMHASPLHILVRRSHLSRRQSLTTVLFGLLLPPAGVRMITHVKSYRMIDGCTSSVGFSTALYVRRLYHT
jgi:hypothetical protein